MRQSTIKWVPTGHLFDQIVLVGQSSIGSSPRAIRSLLMNLVPIFSASNTVFIKLINKLINWWLACWYHICGRKLKILGAHTLNSTLLPLDLSQIFILSTTSRIAAW